jgi:hypothetical protein
MIESTDKVDLDSYNNREFECSPIGKQFNPNNFYQIPNGFNETVNQQLNHNRFYHHSKLLYSFHMH